MTVEAAPAHRRLGIGLIIGIVLLPIVFAWFTLRKGHSALARVLSLGWMALFLIIGLAGGGEQPTTATQPLKAEQAKPAKAPLDTKAVEAKAAAQAEAAKAAAGKLWTAVELETRRCDYKVQDLGTKNDVLSMYMQARDAAETCLQASKTIGGMEPPAGVSAEQRKLFEEAIKACDEAYTAKWYGMTQLQKVLDGKGGLEAQAKLQDIASATQAGTMLCVARFMTAGASVGYTLPQMEKAAAAAN